MHHFGSRIPPVCPASVAERFELNAGEEFSELSRAVGKFLRRIFLVPVIVPNLFCQLSGTLVGRAHDCSTRKHLHGVRQRIMLSFPGYSQLGSSYGVLSRAE